MLHKRMRHMNAPDYICPKCGGADFKRWELPHPLILHWILNPGIAVNEVFLGQRLPKLQLICNRCEGPLMNRGYVPCPACGTMHFGRLWSRKRSFGNWRGIACPMCGAAIPCLWNVFSRLLLAVTFPIWALPYCFWFCKRPLKRIYQMESGELPKVKPITRKMWFAMGAAYGGLMWVCMSLLPALAAMRKHEVSWVPVLIGVPLWGSGGALFGACMWFILGRKRHVGNALGGSSGDAR